MRNADFLEPPTIYRPSIIVGDARTGYTTTFHGFYTPLKAVFSAMHLIDPNWSTGTPLMTALGLSGKERKNLVPVDWVSAILTRIVDRPDLHGRTYHVTSPRPVPVSLFTETMEQAVRAQMSRNDKAKPATSKGADIVKMFMSQMQVYRTYWRDDPQFDQRNLLEAAADLPCPEMTREVLLRLIDFAIRTNFGWPRSRPILAEFDISDHLRQFLPLEWEAANGDGTESRIGLQINGPGGGCWELVLRNRQLVAAKWGLSERAGTVLLSQRPYIPRAGGGATDGARRGVLGARPDRRNGVAGTGTHGVVAGHGVSAKTTGLRIGRPVGIRGCWFFRGNFHQS